MTYEGQVAGVQDDVPTSARKSLVVRRLKALSLAQLAVRRREIADALARGGRPGVLERRRLRLGRGDRRRPGGHRGRRRLRACWCRASSTTTARFEPRPAAFFGLPGDAAPVAGDGDRARRRPGRLRPDRRRPAADARGRRRACT